MLPESWYASTFELLTAGFLRCGYERLHGFVESSGYFYVEGSCRVITMKAVDWLADSYVLLAVYGFIPVGLLASAALILHLFR